MWLERLACDFALSEPARSAGSVHLVVLPLRYLWQHYFLGLPSSALKLPRAARSQSRISDLVMDNTAEGPDSPPADAAEPGHTLVPRAASHASHISAKTVQAHTNTHLRSVTPVAHAKLVYT
jgi:hypothetical protein